MTLLIGTQDPAGARTLELLARGCGEWTSVGARRSGRGLEGDNYLVTVPFVRRLPGNLLASWVFVCIPSAFETTLHN